MTPVYATTIENGHGNKKVIISSIASIISDLRDIIWIILLVLGGCSCCSGVAGAFYRYRRYKLKHTADVALSNDIEMVNMRSIDV